MVERTFRLPDLGEGIAEGELVSWAVEPGDEVVEDQVLAEVETDKALVEIPSPFDGVVTELHAAAGEMVPVDSVVVTFDVDEADAPAGDGSAADAGGPETEAVGSEASTPASGSAEERTGGRVFASPSTRSLARELGVSLAAVAGSGPGGRITESDVRAAAGGGDDAAGGTASTGGASTAATASETGEPVSVEAGEGPRERTLAMPATRRLADELGVDLNAVPASEEREGEPFVTPEDVRAYAEGGVAGGTAATASAEAPESGTAAGGGSAATSAAGASGDVPGERVPYRGIRRTIGDRMAQSKYTAPHVSHFDEFDATALVDLREDLRDAAEREGVKLTYLPFVVKAVTVALRDYPYLNASLDEEAGEIVLHDEYNVGIAVATDAGLMVPVVKRADRKGLRELAADIEDLATRARDRSLTRDEMQGGTFTITNVGVIGGEYSTPIINYPEAGILAMGPLEKRPWVVDDEVVARETMTLSMSVVHRLVDGAEAAGFTNRVQELLGKPARLLLE